MGLHRLKREEWPTEKSLADPTLHLYLVDTNLQIILAMRQISMEVAFYSVLRKNIEAQMAHSVDSKAFAKSVQCAWRERTPEQMREQASAVQEVPMELTAHKMLN